MAKRRYVRAWQGDGEWAYEETSRGNGLTVFEPDFEPMRTGLVDKTGAEIMRVEQPNPIGFLTEIED